MKKWLNQKSHNSHLISFNIKKVVMLGVHVVNLPINPIVTAVIKVQNFHHLLLIWMWIRMWPGVAAKTNL